MEATAELEAAPTEDDVDDTHDVYYTVTQVEYTTVIASPALFDKFTVRIICPSTYTFEEFTARPITQNLLPSLETLS